MMRLFSSLFGGSSEDEQQKVMAAFDAKYPRDADGTLAGTQENTDPEYEADFAYCQSIGIEPHNDGWTVSGAYDPPPVKSWWHW